MIQKNYINDKVIIEIDNFLSEEECDSLLNDRISKFDLAISHYPQYYRNNSRLVEDNLSLSTDLFKKVSSLDIDELKPAVRLNEKLRFCAYKRGQEFTKHKDGVYYPSDDQASCLTFLLYLNNSEEFVGGETNFFSTKSTNECMLKILPKKGKLVVFDHTIWHNGGKVEKGVKYILRSDFIFELPSKPGVHKGYIWCLEKLNIDQFMSGGRDAVIREWNGALELINSFKIHSNSVIRILQLNNQEFISCSRDMTLKKWTSKGNLIQSINLDSMVLCMEKHVDKIVMGNTNGELIVLNENLEVMHKFIPHQGWVWDLRITDSEIYSVSEFGELIRTQFNGTSEVCYKHSDGLFSMNMKDDNIYMGSQQGALVVYTRSNKTVETHQIHTDIIRKIKFKGNQIITCGEDNKLYTFYHEKFLIASQTNFIQDFIFMDNKIISAGFDGELKIHKITIPHKLIPHKP